MLNQMSYITQSLNTNSARMYYFLQNQWPSKNPVVQVHRLSWSFGLLSELSSQYAEVESLLTYISFQISSKLCPKFSLSDIQLRERVIFVSKHNKYPSLLRFTLASLRQVLHRIDTIKIKRSSHSLLTNNNRIYTYILKSELNIWIRQKWPHWQPRGFPRSNFSV